MAEVLGRADDHEVGVRLLRDPGGLGQGPRGPSETRQLPLRLAVQSGVSWSAADAELSNDVTRRRHGQPQRSYDEPPRAGRMDEAQAEPGVDLGLLDRVRVAE